MVTASVSSADMVQSRRAASARIHAESSAGGCQPSIGFLFLPGIQSSSSPCRANLALAIGVAGVLEAVALGVGADHPCLGSYYPTRGSYYRQGARAAGGRRQARRALKRPLLPVIGMVAVDGGECQHGRP